MILNLDAISRAFLIPDEDAPSSSALVPPSAARKTRRAAIITPIDLAPIAWRPPAGRRGSPGWSVDVKLLGKAKLRDLLEPSDRPRWVRLEEARPPLGREHSRLSFTREATLIADWERRATNGEEIDLRTMAPAYQAAAGGSLPGNNTLSRMLARHGYFVIWTNRQMDRLHSVIMDDTQSIEPGTSSPRVPQVNEPVARTPRHGRFNHRGHPIPDETDGAVILPLAQWHPDWRHTCSAPGFTGRFPSPTPDAVVVRLQQLRHFMRHDIPDPDIQHLRAADQIAALAQATEPTMSPVLFMECGLLVGLSDERIARCLGRDPKVVRFFHDAYFSVRSYLAPHPSAFLRAWMPPFGFSDVSFSRRRLMHFMALTSGDPEFMGRILCERSLVTADVQHIAAILWQMEGHDYMTNCFCKPTKKDRSITYMRRLEFLIRYQIPDAPEETSPDSPPRAEAGPLDRHANTPVW